MKSLLTTAVAGLMLLGIFSAVTPNNHAKKNAPVLMGDGGPIPLCYPTEPNCQPPIPPANPTRR